jgi:hypothetical protein
MRRGRRGTGWAVLTMTALMLMSSPWAAIGGSTGELVDDAIITSKVKASLVADPTVSALDINRSSARLEAPTSRTAEMVNAAAADLEATAAMLTV